MLSIENTYSLEELKKYGERVAKLLPGETVEWVVELKVDGVAVSLIYEDGLLTHGVTRGNGRTRRRHHPQRPHDQGHSAAGSLCQGRGDVPPPLLEVRGEIYMTNSDLVLLNEAAAAQGRAAVRQYAQCDGRQHPATRPAGLRRAAAAVLLPQCRRYRRARRPKRTWSFSTNSAATAWRPRPTSSAFRSFAAAVEHCEELIERLHELDFEIDGLVLKVNRFDQRERLGSTSKSPRWVIAYKFEKYEATTRLNDIRVQVGKTGAITPVADLEPVELAGTTVSRASLHNADEIERKDVRVGDMVVVEKAGKIIPHIVRVEKHLRPKDCRVAEVRFSRRNVPSAARSS